MELISKIKDDVADVVRLQIIDNQGKVTAKVITFQEYIHLLYESQETTNAMQRIGQLPNGYFDGAIHPTQEKTFRCVIVLPATQIPITYQNSEYVIPFPSLVFYFEVESGRITGSRVWALTDERPNERSMLYAYPFGNVYKDARICWGGNSLPELSTMKELDGVISLFFGSPTNDDLFNATDKFSTDAPEYVLTQRALFETLKGMETFPKQILREEEHFLGEIMEEL